MTMMSWQAAPCLLTLRDQIDRAWPDRDRASDGIVGDLAHVFEGRPTVNAAGYGVTGTDHLPDLAGYVCALDIDDGLAPGVSSWDLARAIASSEDTRIGYIISHGQIYSSRAGASPFAWRPYTGDDPHTGHMHLSVRHGPRQRDSTAAWDIGLAQPPEPRGPTKVFFATRSNGTSYLFTVHGRSKLAKASDVVAVRNAGVPEADLSDASIDAVPVAVVR